MPEHISVSNISKYVGQDVIQGLGLQPHRQRQARIFTCP